MCIYIKELWGTLGGCNDNIPTILSDRRITVEIGKYNLFMVCSGPYKDSVSVDLSPKIDNSEYHFTFINH